MHKSFRNILVLTALGGVFGASVAAAEEAAKRERPSPEQRAERHEKMKQRFNKIDANQDGKLSRDEAQQGAPKLAEHFDKLDANGDGQVTPIEMREARRAHKGDRPHGPGKPEPRSGS